MHINLIINGVETHIRSTPGDHAVKGVAPKWLFWRKIWRMPEGGMRRLHDITDGMPVNSC